jgi:O-antigen/teichoic acid export membrane protein
LTLTETENQPSVAVPDRRFSRSVALTMTARAWQVGVSLTANMLIARWLGESGLGTLAVINVTMAITLQLASLGLPNANIYFVARDRAQLGPLWANSAVFGFLSGVGAVSLLALLIWFRPQLFGEIPVQLLFVSAAAVPVLFLTVVGLNLLLGLDRVGIYNIFDTLMNGVTFFSAVITLLLLGGGLTLMVYGSAAGNITVGIAVSLVICYLWYRQPNHRSLMPNWRLFYRTLRYGLKFHFSLVASLLLVRVDVLLVNHFNGTKAAGVYAAAAQIGTLLLLVPGVVSSLLFPRVASDADTSGTFAMRVTRHLAMIMFVGCVLTIPASFLLPLLYGAKFNGAVMLLWLLLPGVFLLGVESVLVQHFSGLGLPRWIPAFWLIALTVNIGLNLIFVPRFGAVAAAIDSSIAYATIFFLVAGLFRSRTGNGFIKTFFLDRNEWRELLSFLPGRKQTTDSTA